jgi:hypothetical protein
MDPKACCMSPTGRSMGLTTQPVRRVDDAWDVHAFETHLDLKAGVLAVQLRTVVLHRCRAHPPMHRRDRQVASTRLFAGGPTRGARRHPSRALDRGNMAAHRDHARAGGRRVPLAPETNAQRRELKVPASHDQTGRHHGDRQIGLTVQYAASSVPKCTRSSPVAVARVDAGEPVGTSLRSSRSRSVDGSTP